MRRCLIAPLLLVWACAGEFVSTAGDGDAGVPPVTAGTDDWPELGHDPGRSFASTDRVAPPLHPVWTWKVASNGELAYAANAVSVGGVVRAHVAGNRTEEHNGSNSPYLQSLSLEAGA